MNGRAERRARSRSVSQCSRCGRGVGDAGALYARNGSSWSGADNTVTGKVYFWEIMIPGSLVGLIVGYATQKFGTSKKAPA